ncbi:MAG: SgcJ/EcaC family oxidoreductase [Acidobacteriia bacterium]|nr:SgcJ/EcaC family oxidoreductase [Terriglobia bacterium]
MKTIYAAILCVLLLLLSACAQKVNDPADIQAIKDTGSAWDKAYNAGNTEALASGYYTDDAVTMDPYQPPNVGKEAIRSALQKAFDQFSDEGRSVVEDVRVSGDLAVARGTTEGKSSLKAGGYSAQFKSKWITAFQRQPDGSWKAFCDIYNSDLPIADSLTPGVEEQALMQIERDWAAANAKNDSAAIDKILAAEYANNTDGLITTKKQALANMRNGASKVASAAAGEMKVLVFGETAVVHGLWNEKSTLNGKDTSGTYRYTDTFIKRDGRWQAATTYSTKMQ